VVIGTRFSLRLLDGGIPVVAADRWVGTRVLVPASIGHLHDVATHRTLAIDKGAIELSQALGDLPVAILRS
jgi:maltooligosyltrehalose synthase